MWLVVEVTAAGAAGLSPGVTSLVTTPSFWSGTIATRAPPAWRGDSGSAALCAVRVEGVCRPDGSGCDWQDGGTRRASGGSGDAASAGGGGEDKDRALLAEDGTDGGVTRMVEGTVGEEAGRLGKQGWRRRGSGRGFDKRMGVRVVESGDGGRVSLMAVLRLRFAVR